MFVSSLFFISRPKAAPSTALPAKLAPLDDEQREAEPDKEAVCERLRLHIRDGWHCMRIRRRNCRVWCLMRWAPRSLKLRSLRFLAEHCVALPSAALPFHVYYSCLKFTRYSHIALHMRVTRPQSPLKTCNTPVTFRQRRATLTSTMRIFIFKCTRFA